MKERFISIFFKPGRTLDHQMFIFGSIAVILGLTAALVVSLVAVPNIWLTVASSVSLVLCIAAIVYAFRTGRYHWGNIVMVILAIYITFPIGILVGGGIYSGVPIWFVLAIVYIAMVFKGRTFFILVSLGLIIFVAASYISYMNPICSRPSSPRRSASCILRFPL